MSGLVLAGLTIACGKGPPGPSEEDAPEAPAPAVGFAPFTLRGRWLDPSALRYRIEPDGGVIPAAGFRAALERALEAWSSTGVVGFRPAAEDEPSDLVFAWRRARHDSCPAFGTGTAMAHSGPVARGTFVHFDAGRTWEGATLEAVALHELGHVLGLGHSPDPNALLAPGLIPATDALTAADRAGLESLYGGGELNPGDLVIRSAREAEGSEPLAVLHDVAPPDRTGWGVFDTDDNGAAEIVVWRTDAAGHGALMIYGFDGGVRPVWTRGPFMGMGAVSAQVVLDRTPEGERVMVLAYPTGRLVVRRFDEHGLLKPWGGRPLVLVSGPIDADGDGQLDEGARLEESAVPAEADLDGDGVPEFVAAVAPVSEAGG